MRESITLINPKISKAIFFSTDLNTIKSNSSPHNWNQIDD
jgi:hypothetical protein